MDIELRIRDEKNRLDTADTPDDLPISEFLKQFIPATGRSFVDQQGASISWILFDESTGRNLDATKSFRENGIHSRHELLLSTKARPIPTPDVPRWRCESCGFKNPETSTFCASCGTRRPGEKVEVMVQDPKGRVLNKKVAPEVAARRFLNDVLAELGLPTDTGWEIDDKDIPRKLALDQTLKENGVLDGHHLFLRATQAPHPPPIPWKRIALAALVTAAVGLCAYAGYKIHEYWVNRPKPVTVVVSPSHDVRLRKGQGKQFSAKVTGSSNTVVTWSTDPVDPVRLGTITADGHYEAPASVSNAVEVAIVATSAADKTSSNRVTISLLPDNVVPPEVSVQIRQPQRTQLAPGEQEQFFADVRGSAHSAVRWSIEPADSGSISQDGTYSAPASIGQTQTVNVIATSAADSTKSAMFSITLIPSQAAPAVHPSIVPGQATPSVHLSIVPPKAELGQNQTQQFTAVADLGGSHPSVRWSVSPKIGRISPAGLYTAPAVIAQQQTIQIRAVAASNPAHGTTATVVLQPPAAPEPTPACGQLQFTEETYVVLHPSQRFQFHVTGAGEDAIQWRVVGPGSIEHGLYVAPASVGPPGTRVFVKARCQNSQEIERVVDLVP